MKQYSTCLTSKKGERTMTFELEKLLEENGFTTEEIIRIYDLMQEEKHRKALKNPIKRWLMHMMYGKENCR